MNRSRRKFIQQATWGALSLAVPLLASCHDNSSSEPAITTIPNPPRDLLTTESLRYVALTWSAPQTNTDGSPLTDLNSFLIYRRELSEPEFKLIFEVEKSGTIFIDATIGSREVVYQVVTKTRRGARSQPSEPSSSARAQLIISPDHVPLVTERRLYDASGAPTQEPTSALLSIERILENGFFALELICTHAGCGGMSYIDEIWRCRCHGSRFDRQGKVVQPPASAPLTRLSAILDNEVGLIVRS